jgi:hypothetical protein
MNTINSRVNAEGHPRTSAELIESAEHGLCSKAELAELLAPDARHAFLDACAKIERRFRDECAGHGDLCLESGCAMEGEACLDALLKAGPAYPIAYGRAWTAIFSDPRNRAEGWKH